MGDGRRHLPLAQKPISAAYLPKSQPQRSKQSTKISVCLIMMRRLLRPLLALAVIASSAPLADSVKVGDKVRKMLAAVLIDVCINDV